MAQLDADLPTRAPPAAADVFVSYSLDAAVAMEVVQALELSGVVCWIAPRDIIPGTFYGDEIVHAIDATKASVLILSRNAGSSQHVLREVERAASKRHPVICLRIDHTALPASLEYFLKGDRWVSLGSLSSPWRDTRWDTTSNLSKHWKSSLPIALERMRIKLRKPALGAARLNRHLGGSIAAMRSTIPV